MQVDLWVAVLRILAAVLAVSILWPKLLQQPWRWMRQARLTKGPADGSPPGCDSVS